MAKNLVVSSPFPENLYESELKSNGLISLAEAISRQHSTESVAWLITLYWSKVKEHKKEQKVGQESRNKLQFTEEEKSSDKLKDAAKCMLRKEAVIIKRNIPLYTRTIGDMLQGQDPTCQRLHFTKKKKMQTYLKGDKQIKNAVEGAPYS